MIIRAEGMEHAALEHEDISITSSDGLNLMTVKVFQSLV